MTVEMYKTYKITVFVACRNVQRQHFIPVSGSCCHLPMSIPLQSATRANEKNEIKENS